MKKVHRLNSNQPLPTGFGAGSGEIRMGLNYDLRAANTVACGHAATHGLKAAYVAVTHNDTLVTCTKCKEA